MKILLVAPPEYRYVKGFTAMEYLGLEYLAAFLRFYGYEIEILDCNLDVTAQQLSKKAAEEKPELIGISIPTLPNIPGAFHIVKNLRQSGYSGIICLGGHVPTFAWNNILSAIPEVDLVIRGEGENTLLELVRTIESNGSFAKVKGLAFRKNGKIILNPPRDLIADINEIPFPSRDILMEIKRLYPTLSKAAILTSRGCYGKCIFCSVHAFYKIGSGPRVRQRTAENVVDEVEYLVKETGISFISFVDDNFIGPGRAGKQRAKEIAQGIMDRKLDIDFTIYCRVNDIEESTLLFLKKAGLSRVFIGIESGVQSMLDRFNKGTSVEQNVKAIDILRKINIAWDAGFILYDPDTTFEELKENVSFIREKALYRYPASVLLLNGLTVYPGTPIEKILESQNRLKKMGFEPSQIIGNVREGLENLSITNALGLFDPDYDILDERVQAIRQVTNLIEAKLVPQYDKIWPLLMEWHGWANSIMEITGFSLGNLKNIKELNLNLGDQLERWCENIGVLVINILESIIDFSESDKTSWQANIILKRLYSMIDQYNMRHFGTSFDEGISVIQQHLEKDNFVFKFNNIEYFLSLRDRKISVSENSRVFASLDQPPS